MLILNDGEKKITFVIIKKIVMYNTVIKPILFSFKPEEAHNLTMKILKGLFYIPGMKRIVKSMYSYNDSTLERHVLGLKFKNVVGLAAGFDKDGKYIDMMSTFGFGYIEVGTVTPLPQDGNPKQRLFRLPDDNCLINRMGFNNDGVEALVERLKQIKKRDYIIGGNIGKNKITPNEKAVDDYIICFNKLFDYVDYFVVNVSSPNTPGLRSLQEKGPLKKILNALSELNNAKEGPKPILLKIAPDLELTQIDDIIEIVQETGINGIISENTTISRENLKTNDSVITTIGNGGLSGPILRQRSTDIVKYIRSKANKDLVIIGVGGINAANDANAKLKAGAQLVQVYTGFIYEGPGMVKRILKGL